MMAEEHREGSAPASSPVPLYERVKTTLLAEINARYQPGDMLPTQAELATRFGASLITIKRAVDEIVRLGLLETVRGRGTIVRRPQVINAQAGVTSWTDAMIDLGEDPTTAWCTVVTHRGDDPTRRLLNLNAHQHVTFIRRLRNLGEKPACLMEHEMPATLVPGLDAASLGESLYGWLEQRGIRPSHADEEVSARAPTKEERTYFGDACGTVLVVRRFTFDADDRLFEISSLIAPAARYTYRVRITAHH